MKLQMTTQPRRSPELREVLKTSAHLSLPPHLIFETAVDFQIAFNLFEAAQSQLHVSLSNDNHRLHVVGTKWFHEWVAEFLWVFELPNTINADDIRIVNSSDVHVIHIPKKTVGPRYFEHKVFEFADRTAVA